MFAPLAPPIGFAPRPRVDAQGFPAVMGRLIYHLARVEAPTAPAIALDPVLLATYFLLDLDNNGNQSTVAFVTHTLSRLLQQLTRSTEQQAVLYEGQVRGRILWPATYKARHNDGFNPNRYVCRQVHQRFDTPENQLLKYLMTQINDCLRLVPESIRRGFFYQMGPNQPLRATAEPLGQIETSLNVLWRNVRLAEISTPDYVTEQHLLKAQTVRFEEYAHAARLYRRYRALVLQPSWEALQEVGTRVVCLPAQTGPWEDGWIALSASLLRSTPEGGT
ncbi:MAG: hypothetical protein H6650_10930 [Ardenticatenales bacterium]|nr:hypothetical protein [Ardenticatenales bacterium]